jgi:hypothetical protein
LVGERCWKEGNRRGSGDVGTKRLNGRGGTLCSVGGESSRPGGRCVSSASESRASVFELVLVEVRFMISASHP